MTSGFGGGATGGADLGSAYGKVRIDYESTGVAKATKELEALQHSTVAAGKSFDATQSQAAKATGAINQLVSAAAKAGKATGGNPVAGLGASVEREVQRAQKAMSGFASTTRSTNGTKTLKVTAPVQIAPSKVSLDQGAINKATQGLGIAPIVIKAPVEITPSDIKLDSGAITNAIQAMSFDAISVDINMEINPKEITFDTGAFKNAADDAAKAFNDQFNSKTTTAGANPGGGGNSGGGGRRGFGGGATALAGRAAIGVAGGAAAVAAAGIAGGGLVAKLGFDRLQGLDAAAIKLTALGKSEMEVKQISQLASDSVDGLSFSLDEAFATAADATNANIPLKDMGEYLKAVANTAALAGVPMQDLGQALNKAAISGKLTGDVFELLVSRNVPILGLLAKQYGVTQQKAQEMVSNGEVDFAHLQAALSQTGEAGRIMGNTVSGSFANMKAAISRLGASLLAPIFGDASGQASLFAQGIQFVTNKLKEVGEWAKSHKNDIIDFWYNAGEGVIFFGHLLVTVFGGAIEVVGQLIKGFGHLATGLAGVVDFLGGDSSGLRDFKDDAQSAGEATFGFGQNIFKLNPILDKAYQGLQRGRQGAHDLANATGDVGDIAGDTSVQMDSLSSSLEKFGVKSDKAETGIEGTVAQFKELLKTLKDKKAPQELIDAVTNLRSQFDNGGRQAKSYADAIDDLGDKTKTAADRGQALINSLQGLGLLPGGDELQAYNQGFRELTDLQQNMPSLLDATGNSLVNLDGTINSSLKNGDQLLTMVKKAQTDLYTLAASGKADPGEAFDQTAKGLADRLQQYGLDPEATQKVINQYLTPGGQGKVAFEAQFSGKNATEVTKDALGNDPAKLDSVLNLLTTKDMIINEITGGPGASIMIPATIDLTNPDVLKPGAPGGPPGISPNSPLAAPPSLASAAPFVPGVGPQPDVFYKNADGSIGKGQPGQLPPGATPLNFDPKKANIEGGKFPHGVPFNQGASITALIDNLNTGAQPGDKPSPYSFNDEFKNLLNDPSILQNSLGKDKQVQDTLAPVIKGANDSGASVADAFAEGINNGSPEVKAAILRLAQLVGDGLGNSPAKYGPLSGKGYSLYRGQKVTQAFAEGVASESDSVKTATTQVAGAAAGGLGSSMGSALNADDGITRLISDLQELSDFGKHLLDFGNQIKDIGFNAAKFANTLTGGRLFPKSYQPDPNAIKPKDYGSFTPSPGSQALNADLPFQGGASSSAPGALGANPGKQQIADYIINKALSQGYSKKQADEFVTQAFGESGLNPKISGGNQSGDEVIGIFQEKTAFSGGLSVADRGDAQKNIDAYFAQAAKAGGPQAFTDPAQFLGKDVSGGGPYHPENQAKGHLTAAQAGVAPYLAGYSGPALPSTGAPTNPATPQNTPPVIPPAAVGPNGSTPTSTSGVYWDGANFIDATGAELNKTADGAWVNAKTGKPLLRTTTSAPPTGTNPERFTPPTTVTPGGPPTPIQSINSATRIGLPDIASKLGGAGQDYTVAGLQAAGIPELFGANGQIPQWFTDFVKANGGKDLTVQTPDGHGSLHGNGSGGYAADISGPDSQLDNLAKTIAGNPQLRSNVIQLIRGTLDGQEVGIAGGQLVDNGGTPYFDKNGKNEYPGHAPGGNSHVHLGVAGGVPGSVPAGLNADAFSGQPGGAITPFQQQLLANTGGLAGLPPSIAALAANNAGLADALSGTPTDQAGIEKRLQALDVGIADSNKNAGPTGPNIFGQQPILTPEQKQAKAQSDYLTQQKNNLLSSSGLKEGPSGLDSAESALNGASGIASDLFGVFDAGLKYIGALKDTGDILVRGIANTGDINKLVDDFQTGLDLASKIFTAAGDITSFAGSFTGGADFGGASAAGQALSLIGQAIAAVNTGIDLAQEGYKIITKYVGRFLTSYLGFPGAEDVNFLLDEVTGQVKAYTSDNPENKTTLNTLKRELNGNVGGERPAVTNVLSVYQGPGQDPRDSMNDAMFAIRASGVGAFGYAS